MKNGESILLLHASDFHMRESEGDPLLRAHDIRQLFVFDAVQRAKEIGSPTALVFSGDIAFSGGPAQYDVARRMFTDILKRLGLKEQRILVVPGNHDVDRPKAEGLDARMLRDKLRAGTDPQAEAEFVAKREELLNPLSAYQEFAMPYDCLIQGENGYWEIDNTNNSSASEYLAADFQFLIRGISTVHASDRNDDQMADPEKPKDDGSHMYVARGQLSCDPVTEECPFRVIVGHHPPSWWRFSTDRGNLIQARYHLHLFGHEHEFTPRPVGKAICVVAGAINPDDASTEQARYNWIKITLGDEGYLVRIWSRVFDHERNEFCEDDLWPGGKGYLISQGLNAEVVVVEPEKSSAAVTDSVTISKPETFPQKASRPIPASTEKQMQQERKSPSSHSVRFALLSQNHAKYALVFKALGYEPSDEQKYTLGGLEYYEEALEKLLRPENIDKLIAAMSKEGIDVC